MSAEGSVAPYPVGRGGVAGSGVRVHYMLMLRRGVENRLQLLESELGTLRETNRALESEMRLLQTEWAETHRKIVNTLRSLNRSGGKTAPVDDEETPTAGVPPGLDPVSARVHARRSRAVPHPVSEDGR